MAAPERVCGGLINLIVLLLVACSFFAQGESTSRVPLVDITEELDGGTPWASAAEEALDERNDAVIFRSVVASMAEWHVRKLARRRRRRADASVCYPEVGCFHDAGPFGYLDMLPSPPEEVATKFYIFSRNSRGDAPIMEVAATNVSSAWSFNASLPTKVIVHGFGSSCSHVWVYEMRSALMGVEECNVICVDWEAGAAIPNYVRAAANTRLVGKQLAQLLAGLEKNSGLQLKKTHLIGFSLGAHVAGFAGAELKNLSRITGLDPAGPLFESQDPRARLDASDAEFVDVIHSNGENLILGGLGTWQPLGHVDFYPNGGRMQKGCANLFVGAVSDILWSASENEARSLCNHRRAYKFFTDSVSPRCHFPAAPCDSYERFISGHCFPCDPPRRPCGNMGYYADRAPGRGALYLATRFEEPFCAHQYHVRVQSSPSVLPVVSYGRIQVTLIGDSELNDTFTLTQKDDEQLQVGGQLSRIVVPHPALREPRAVQLLYTAYSGWISSGLARWSVDKVALSDSFGKTSSVCKKDLVLDSNVPVTLPLFPGECHPPRESTTTEISEGTTKETASSGQPPSPSSSGASPSAVLGLSAILANANTSIYRPFTQVVHAGDDGLPEDPLAFLDGPNSDIDPSDIRWRPLPFLGPSGGNSLESTRGRDDARSLDSHPPEFHNATPAASSEKTPIIPENTTSARPEISEPILSPAAAASSEGTSISTRRSREQNKPEITEPVLKPMSSTDLPESNVTSTTSKTVTPVRESATTLRELVTADWTPAVDLNPPPLGTTQIWQPWTTPSKLSERSATVISSSRRSHNNSRSFSLFDSPDNGPPPPPLSNNTTTERSITVQLLPQRLVALLEQAERYARLAFLPFAAVNNLFGGREAEASAPATPPPAPSLGSDSPPRRPKLFESRRTPLLVPLSYSQSPRYIPVGEANADAPSRGSSS